MLTREDIAFMYLEQLPFEPYPFQEEAILDWFSSEQGTLVCAPTRMGKTLIAEAGIYEVMKTGKKAYYTTPLIALTEQKYRAKIINTAKPPSNAGDTANITSDSLPAIDAKIPMRHLPCPAYLCAARNALSLADVPLYAQVNDGQRSAGRAANCYTQLTNAGAASQGRCVYAVTIRR